MNLKFFIKNMRNVLALNLITMRQLIMAMIMKAMWMTLVRL